MGKDEKKKKEKKPKFFKHKKGDKKDKKEKSGEGDLGVKKEIKKEKRGRGGLKVRKAEERKAKKMAEKQARREAWEAEQAKKREEKGEDAPKLTLKQKIALKQAAKAGAAVPAPSFMGAKEYKALQDAASTVATESAAVQADFLWKHCERVTKASPLERKGLAASNIQVLPSTSSSSSLEDRILAARPSLKSGLNAVPSSRGAPLVLIVGGNAAVANGAIKLMPGLNKTCKVAKLFARHFKVPEQVKMLKDNPVNVAVGTPNRLLKLLEEGALKLDRLSFILLDLARDLKQRTVLDMPETAQDFWRLFQGYLGPRLEAESNCKVGLIELPQVVSEPRPEKEKKEDKGKKAAAKKGKIPEPESESEDSEMDQDEDESESDDEMVGGGGAPVIGNAEEEDDFGLELGSDDEGDEDEDDM